MWKYHFYLFLDFILNIYVLGTVRTDPLVETNVGLIRGLAATDGDYSMYMGIPYATVDEHNPFGAAIPHPVFDGVFEAFDDSSICPQIEEFNHTIVGTLDCLHLNIYVPNTASTENPRPVLVYIYGGGFSIGFAGRFLYGPRYLVRHDIIVVTMNYRLGPYGFMCLDTPTVTGNQGLKDQLLALKWIKNNIEAFGGNANQITISGNSAGSISVDLHLHYNDVDLFNKAILQSGFASSSWVMGQPDYAYPQKLADRLGFITNDVNEALNFLSAVDTDLLIATASELGIGLSVCVEKEFDGVERYITDYPGNVQPKLENHQIIIGFNREELLIVYAFLLPEDYKNINSFNNYMKIVFGVEYETYAEIVQQFYIADKPITHEVMWKLLEYDSDFIFIYPSVLSIRKYIENGASNVYYYMFTHDGERNFVKHRENITMPGANHADEIGYLFDISYMTAEPSSVDQYVIDSMTMAWADFVKYGNPTPETSSLPVKWEPVTPEIMHCLEIGYELKLINRPLNDRMAFWDLLYKQSTSIHH